MFEARLRAALAALCIIAVVLSVRLVELQIVRGDFFRREADQALLLRPRSIPFARGSLMDRRGEVLVSDEPCWDIEVEFDVIAAVIGGDEAALRRELRKRKREHRYDETLTNDQAADAFRTEVSESFDEIARHRQPAAADDSEDIRSRARRIFTEVMQLRKAVADRRGYDARIAEEQESHALAAGLDRSHQVEARMALSRYPWVTIAASTSRTYAPNCESLGHIVGRLGRVDVKRLESDPQADDPFARYLPHETVGVSGVEYALESTLRGRRGQVRLDRAGDPVEPPVPPRHGGDVRLSIDAGLQRRLYDLLGERTAMIEESSGAAAVVIDAATREVLALVSYPAFDPRLRKEQYETLRNDVARTPLLFRAVASRYAPGSIVKPLTCLAGLCSGQINLEHTEHCNGYLLVDQPDKWRCWEMHGTDVRMAHGDVDVIRALRGSCNIFMFRVGERLGVDRLCEMFDRAGLGRSSGTGLIEENTGVNPTREWLATHRNTQPFPAHARNFSIGQGELLATPLQAANLAAFYATGRFAPVQLLWGAESAAAASAPISPAALQSMQQGLFEVVNHPDGTAYKYARLSHPRYALCGKTGSATAFPWPTSFRVAYTDELGRRAESVVPGGSKEAVFTEFARDHSDWIIDRAATTTATRWPPNAAQEDNYSHAWFIGYLQALKENKTPDAAQRPRLAFAVLVEFGGSGSRTSGPLAVSVAEELLRAQESGELRLTSTHGAD